MQNLFACAALVAMLASPAMAGESASFRVATFRADITPPIGHPLIGGLRNPAKTIGDRLEARGWVLLGPELPLVFCTLDWCELRNDAYDAWRDRLAKAAGTKRERILVTCVHQHDAPYVDLTAQRLLAEAGLPGEFGQPAFFEQALDDTATALVAAVKQATAVTHLGLGKTTVEGVACNRRVELPGQMPRFNRYSATRDPEVRDAPEGLIDPELKTLSFWSGETPVCATSFYAVHPMSYYGGGEVSGDFPALARSSRQRETSTIFQIYASGAAGDLTAAKFNRADAASRRELADKLRLAMGEAWKATRRVPLTTAQFRNVQVALPPPHEGALSLEALQKTIADAKAATSTRYQAALGLSYRLRCDAGQKIDVPVIDFGPAHLLLLPAEAFVQFQISAATARPDQMSFVAGYGECGPGYIPTMSARKEGFVDEHGYTWNRPDAEESLTAAIRQVLAKP